MVIVFEVIVFFAAALLSEKNYWAQTLFLVPVNSIVLPVSFWSSCLWQCIHPEPCFRHFCSHAPLIPAVDFVLGSGMSDQMKTLMSFSIRQVTSRGSRHDTESHFVFLLKTIFFGIY